MKPQKLKQLAWNDIHNNEEDQAGLMNCYCSSLAVSQISKEISDEDYWIDVGGNWNQVRNTPEGMSSNDKVLSDKLSGTEMYGYENHGNMNKTWAIEFD